MVETKKSTRPTRASSTKPASKAADTITRGRPRSQPTKRRAAASPDRAASPPPKRSRPNSSSKKPTQRSKTAESQGVLTNGATNGVEKKAKAQATPAPPPKKKIVTPKPATISAPYFNPLPTSTEHVTPGLQLFAWGTGNFGQFGMGPDVLAELPKPKKNTWAEEKMEDNTFGEDKAGIETIAAGGLHTLFIDGKGTVWSCGVNDDAALGRVTTAVPDPENPGSFLDVDDLTAIPHPLQSLVDEKFRAVKITAGDSISAAVSAEGEFRVWGSFRANEGSLGFSGGLKHQFTPVSVLKLPQKPGNPEKVVDVVSGSNHLVVLTTHGHIFTWGAGEQAQLGRKILERRKIHGTVPERILLGDSPRRKAILIGSGIYHSFAVDAAGDLWGWGLNTMGQTGTGAGGDTVLTPEKVVGLSKKELGGDTVIQMTGGDHHSLFLTSQGKVYSCGRSTSGQLGLAADDPALADRPDPDFLATPALVTFPDDDPIVHISSGPHYNMAVSKGGALYSWGQGTQGELGAGDEEEITTPRMIVRKEGGSWKAEQVACGGQHGLGLFRKKN